MKNPRTAFIVREIELKSQKKIQTELFFFKFQSFFYLLMHLILSILILYLDHHCIAFTGN